MGRFQPHIEPLLDRQMSLDEIVFVLNRQGAKLRPLLRFPPEGLPVFNKKTVLMLIRHMIPKKEDGIPRGRLVREKWLPAAAPGAPYRFIKETYAQVPPLDGGGDSSKPWDPKDYGMEPVDPFEGGSGARQWKL